jgi:hypothetical protein
MADNLPINFAVPTENIINSYSSIDLVSGFGILTLYGMSAIGEDASEYALTNQITHSGGSVTFTGLADTSSQWVDFDGGNFTIDSDPVSKNITINGEVMIEVAVGVRCTGNTVGYGIKSVTVQKYDGTTATNLVVIDGSQVRVSVGATANAFANGIFKGTISEKVIKKGEKIRLFFEAERYGTAGAGTAGTGQIGLNPKNITEGYFTPDSSTGSFSHLKAYIPIKIEI